LAGAMAELGGFAGVLGFGKVARRYLALADSVAVSTGNIEHIAHVNMVNSLYSVGNMEWGRAQTSIDTCLRLSSDVNDRVNWGNAQTIFFWKTFFTKRFEKARNEAQILAAHGRQHGNLQQESWGLHTGLFTNVQQSLLNGKVDFSDHPIDRGWRAIDLVGQLDVSSENVHVESAFSCLLWLADERSEALRLYHTCLDRIRLQRNFSRHSMGQCLFALFFVAIGNYLDNGHGWADVELIRKRLNTNARRFPVSSGKALLADAISSACNKRESRTKELLLKGRRFCKDHGLDGEAPLFDRIPIVLNSRLMCSG